MAYTTNLTVPQFEVLEPLLPKSKTNNSSISRHQIINAIFYQLKNGCQWRDLPAEFPNWSTVYSQFRRWQLNGTWQEVLLTLAKSERQQEKKNEFPSLLIGDSMCAKNTDTADVETKGYCWYKNCNGIKRHLLVDVLGTPYFVHGTPAKESDDEGLLTILRENKEYFLALPEGHRITILLDNGYHQELLEEAIKQIDARLASRLKIEIAEKITPEQRAEAKAANPAKQGFVVIAKRWIVERTNAWVNQCRVLWKNCEGGLRTSEAKIRICAIRLILRRLA